MAEVYCAHKTAVFRVPRAAPWTQIQDAGGRIQGIRASAPAALL